MFTTVTNFRFNFLLAELGNKLSFFPILVWSDNERTKFYSWSQSSCKCTLPSPFYPLMVLRPTQIIFLSAQCSPQKLSSPVCPLIVTKLAPSNHKTAMEDGDVVSQDSRMGAKYQWEPDPILAGVVGVITVIIVLMPVVCSICYRLHIRSFPDMVRK